LRNLARYCNPETEELIDHQSMELDWPPTWAGQDLLAPRI
jgi:hypothetical protein